MNNQTNIVEYVIQQEEFFTPVLSDQNITWAKESQFAIQALQKNEYLRKIAENNRSSLQNAIINVAAVGVTLNPAAKHAYLVPRDGGVCLDISYMGLLHIAMQSGSILWGQCKLVHENDEYVSNGLDKAPTHKYTAFGERGIIIGGYCTVKTPGGDYLTEEMSIDEIKKIESTSKAKKGPWKTFWEEMARKTIVKRASKYWPSIDRLDTAIHYLNTDGGQGLQEETEKEIFDNVDERITKIVEERTTPDQFFKWVSKNLGRQIIGLDQMSETEKQDLCRHLEAKK